MKTLKLQHQTVDATDTTATLAIASHFTNDELVLEDELTEVGAEDPQFELID